MEYLDLETALSGGFYLTLSLWWFLSVATKYASCTRGNTEFCSRVTYPCCGAFNKLPIEGALKLLAGCLIAILSAIKCYKDCDEDRKLGEVTVFIVFSVSGLCDILTQKCQRYVFFSFDYFILMFAFLIQSVVSASHEDLTSPLAAADNCTMYAAAAVAFAILLEFKFTDVLWFSLLRSFSTFLLGTWIFHVSFILGSDRYKASQSKSNTTVSSAENFDVVSNITHTVTSGFILQESHTIWNEDYLSLVPMYFMWHCFVDMVVFTVLWLVVHKCSSRQICRQLFSMYEEENESHFEHHIHFDYHIIDRLDTDGE